MTLSIAEFALRLGVGLGCGALIGIERQWQARRAGLRTNALVATGATLFVLYAVVTNDSSPTRVASYVVSGVGFLGGGVILREGVNVHGLNTAATLWCSAMVGTLAGAGLLGPSMLAAAFVIVTNLFLRPLVRRLNTRSLTATDVETYYTVEITCRGAEEAHMRSLLLQALTHAGLGLRRLDSEDIPDTSKVTV